MMAASTFAPVAEKASRVVRPPSNEDVLRFLKYLRGQSRLWEGQRLYALVATVVFTGLNREEVLDLLIEDVNLAKQTVWVRRREWLNYTSRPALLPTIPIPRELKPILASWLPKAGSEYLFPGHMKRGRWEVKEGKYCQNALKTAARAAGLTYDMTFPGLRHFYLSRPHLALPIGGKYRSIIIRGPNDPVFVEGRSKGVLNPAEFDVLIALVKVAPGALTRRQLEVNSDRSSARAIIRTMMDRDADWRNRIHCEKPQGGSQLLYWIEI